MTVKRVREVGAKIPRRKRLFGKFDERLEPIKEHVSTSPTLYFIALVVAAFTAVVTSLTMLQIFGSFEDSKEALIDRAWEQLMRRTPGSTGKGHWLNVLFSTDQETADTDISCENLGEWSEPEKRCVRAPEFHSVNIPYDDGFTPRIREDFWFDRLVPDNSIVPNFSYDEINYSDFSNTVLIEKNFTGVVFTKSSLRNATLFDRIPHLHVQHSDVSGAVIDNNNLSALRRNNISSMQIVFTEETSPPRTFDFASRLRELFYARGNWFWGDSPPVVVKIPLWASHSFSFSTSFLGKIPDIAVIICDPRFRADNPKELPNWWWRRPMDIGFDGESQPNMKDYTPLIGRVAVVEGKVINKYTGKRMRLLCPRMTYNEARTLWPDKYFADINDVPVPVVLTDDGHLATYGKRHDLQAH